MEHPWLRGPEAEIGLKSYRKLRERDGFSEELLRKVLRGLSGRRYQETLVEVAKAFGVSASSVSRHLVEVTAQKLKEFRERSLTPACLGKVSEWLLSFHAYPWIVPRWGHSFKFQLASV